MCPSPRDCWGEGHIHTGAAYATLNWAMLERSSAARTLSWAAAAAACLEPTAYCRDTSETWVIAETT